MILYKSNAQLNGFQSYGSSKLVFKKFIRPFGFEATFFASLYSESLLSERSGFESRPGQTLRVCIFKNIVFLGFLVAHLKDLNHV